MDRVGIGRWNWIGLYFNTQWFVSNGNIVHKISFMRGGSRDRVCSTVLSRLRPDDREGVNSAKG